MIDNLSTGYVSLYRSFMQSDIWASRSPAVSKVAIACLLRANHKDVFWNNQTIRRGSFVTSMRTLADECKISRQTLYRSFLFLKARHFIRHEPRHLFTIISVINYEQYQRIGITTETATETQTGASRSNGVTTTVSNLDTNNNNKIIKEGLSNDILNQEPEPKQKPPLFCKDCLHFKDPSACPMEKFAPNMLNNQSVGTGCNLYTIAEMPEAAPDYRGR